MGHEPWPRPRLHAPPRPVAYERMFCHNSCPQVPGRLAHLLAARGDLPHAANYFERSVYLKPDDAEIRINYAVTLAGLDRLPDARRQIDAALKADPKSREANNFLGTLLENTGPRDEALNEFLRAAQLRPDFGLAHWNVTRVLWQRAMRPRRDYNSRGHGSADPGIRARALRALGP